MTWETTLWSSVMLQASEWVWINSFFYMIVYLVVLHTFLLDVVTFYYRQCVKLDGGQRAYEITSQVP